MRCSLLSSKLRLRSGSHGVVSRTVRRLQFALLPLFTAMAFAIFFGKRLDFGGVIGSKSLGPLAVLEYQLIAALQDLERLGNPVHGVKLHGVGGVENIEIVRDDNATNGNPIDVDGEVPHGA